MLRLFIERGLSDAVVLYVVDAEAAEAAAKAGVGSRVAVALGGKSSPLLGPPVEVRCCVV